MRRLLIVTTILTCCASLLLVGIRALHAESVSAACIQLLSPTTGDVLTVDAQTGTPLFDARHDFPVSLAYSDSYYSAPFSPDRTHFIEAVAQNYAASTFKLWLHRRSTTYQRPLTPNREAYYYRWSLDSQHIAYVEVREWNVDSLLVNLVITDADATVVKRETLTVPLDILLDARARQFSWSPDSSLFALFTAQRTSTALSTLVLRPVDAEQSIYVPFPNQSIQYVTWSPDSQSILVFTTDLTTSPKAMLYVLQRDGQLLKQIPLRATFNVDYVTETSDGLNWSSDGRYFFLYLGRWEDPQFELIDLDSDHPISNVLGSANSPFSWSSQPHVLIYTTEHGYNDNFHSVDVVTGQSTLLADSVRPQYWRWRGSGTQVLLLIGNGTAGRYSLHLIPRDLSHIDVPFGEFQSQSNVYSEWSNDGQRLLVVSEEASTFTIRWLLRSSGEIKQFQFPKQGVKNEHLSASWLTDDFMVLTYSTPDRITVWSLDTHLSQAVSLFTVDASTSYSLDVLDDTRIEAAMSGSLFLYRLSDGAVLFSDISPYTGEKSFTLSPDERSALLYRDPNMGIRHPILTLITDHLTELVSNADSITLPAWSSDGESFAFAAIEKTGTGWAVNIMSRAGKLLQNFHLPTSTGSTPYEQVRWTDCG